MRIGLLGIGALASVIGIGPVYGQSLETEISKLLENHPKLRAAQNKIAEAEEGINRRFADFLPKVNVTGDYGRQVTDNPPLRSTNRSPLATKAGSAQVTVTQNLFKGFKSDARYEQAKITRTLAEIALDSKALNLLFDAASAYLDVMRYSRLKELAIKNEQNIREQLFLEDERVEKGSGIEVDVLFAKARLQIATERRTVSEGNYLNSLSAYSKVFGALPGVINMALPRIPTDLLPTTVEEALAIAKAENPTVIDSEKTIKLNEEGIRLAKAPFYPQVDLIGKGNLETDYDGVDGLHRDVSVRVQLSWDIYTGLSTPAESRAANSRYHSSLNERDDVRRDITEEVQLAWDRLGISRQRAALLKNAVNIASEVYDARIRLGEVGKETVINILDAQSEVFSAQIEAVDAEFDSYIAVYRLLLAIGRLQPNVFAAKL
jgi:adhesin transport system outer membrane protein